MRPRLADPALTLELTWIWLGVLLKPHFLRTGSTAGGAVAIRKPLPAPRSYSAELGEPNAETKSGRARSGKRRNKVSRKTLPRQRVNRSGINRQSSVRGAPGAHRGLGAHLVDDLLPASSAARLYSSSAAARALQQGVRRPCAPPTSAITWARASWCSLNDQGGR